MEVTVEKFRFENNTFIIEDYDEMLPFSEFLPGIAGAKGIPLWLFYTNRGQGVNSFGFHDKDHAIMEFNPANTAYENTAIKGFRTFIKINGAFYEPFHGYTEDCKRTMYLHENSFWIEEINEKVQTKIIVKYYLLPNEAFGALVRKVTVTNLSEEEVKLEMLDGLPKVIPYGIKNSEYKEMSNLLKSWTELKKGKNQLLFYTTRASNENKEEVSQIKEGYFYISFRGNQILAPIYDNDIIFGYDTSFEKPVYFMKHPLKKLLECEQVYANRIPGGFSPVDCRLQAGETLELNTLIGLSHSLEEAELIATKVIVPGYLEQKEKEAEHLISFYTKDVKTKTRNPLFDQYIRQCYLDNFLRGGYPFLFKTADIQHVVYLFSRKHGDPERDYNFFSTRGEYYSQGNGNFRDVNQNRRNDVFFHPQIGDFNVKTFFSLLQADGYNPLEVSCSTFTVKADKKMEMKLFIEKAFREAHAQNIINHMVELEFTPGQLFKEINTQGLQMNMDEDIILQQILALCDQNIEAVFKEGYWSDHFTYHMDLVEDYLRIYPDRKKQFLFDEDIYRFYDSPVRVLPRREKYVITQQGVRQFGAITKDLEKEKNKEFIPNGTNWLRDYSGKVVTVSLYVKILSLVSVKFATLDPEGMGIEMEAGKPDWNDAMNGLPGLIGSGMPETIELVRLIHFLMEETEEENEHSIPEEIHMLMNESIQQINQLKGNLLSEFEYWDNMASARENYREIIRFSMSGQKIKVTGSWLKGYLSAALNKLLEGIDKAIKLGNGLLPTYFTYKVINFEPYEGMEGAPATGYQGLPLVKVKSFELVVLPTFLEGPARYLKILSVKKQAEELFERIKKSDLYDEKLRMYKTSIPLDNLSMEVGRIRAFTPGWLERESIFLHMEYKYLLGILKAGLYESFFEEAKNILIPFLKPEVYGRSTIENSSFIASSRNPDPSTHGRGYVARLSGSTTEVLSMWIYIMTGDKPFTYENSNLIFSLNPILPEWFFNAEDEVEFQLFSNTTIIYRNPKRRDTFGEAGVCVKEMIISGISYGNKLMGEVAEKLRNGEITEIICRLE